MLKQMVRHVTECERLTNELRILRPDLDNSTIVEKIREIAEPSLTMSHLDILRRCRRQAIEGKPMPWEPPPSGDRYSPEAIAACRRIARELGYFGGVRLDDLSDHELVDRICAGTDRMSAAMQQASVSAEQLAQGFRRAGAAINAAFADIDWDKVKKVLSASPPPE